MTSSPSPSTLLVRLPNPLGDVVMTTPLLRALRTAWPDCRIVTAGKPPYGALLEGLDSVDAFLPLGSAEPHHETLRQAEAEVALILPNSWSSAVAAARAGIPRRIGRRNQGRGLLLHDKLPPIPGPAPMTELYCDFLPALGLPRRVPEAELVVTRSPATPIPSHAKLIAVAPGAAFGPSKVYPMHLLQQVLETLAKDHGYTPLLLGSPAEQDLLAHLEQALPYPTVRPAPEDLGLDETKALLAASEVALCMDNGARHMAAALGTPQVVLYGPTHPAWSAHGLEKTTILKREELDCLGCHHKECPLPDHPCMHRMTPEAVLDGILAAG